jgi:hypothetical protein
MASQQNLSNPFEWGSSPAGANIDDVLAFIASADIADLSRIGEAGKARWLELNQTNVVVKPQVGVSKQVKSVTSAIAGRPIVVTQTSLPISSVPKVGYSNPEGVPYGQAGSGYHLEDGKLYKVQPKKEKFLQARQAENAYEKAVKSLTDYCKRNNIPKGSPITLVEHQTLVDSLEEAKAYKAYVKLTGEFSLPVQEWRSQKTGTIVPPALKTGIASPQRSGKFPPPLSPRDPIKEPQIGDSTELRRLSFSETVKLGDAKPKKGDPKGSTSSK